MLTQPLVIRRNPIEFEFFHLASGYSKLEISTQHKCREVYEDPEVGTFMNQLEGQVLF
jgi:hypothetical protein